MKLGLCWQLVLSESIFTIASIFVLAFPLENHEYRRSRQRASCWIRIGRTEESTSSQSDPCHSCSIHNAFQNLVQNLVETVIASDSKRDTKGQDGASTGWTSWVDEMAVAKLSNAVAAMRFVTVPRHHHDWKRWIMSCPAPTIFDYTPFLANEVQLYMEAKQEESKNSSNRASSSSSSSFSNKDICSNHISSRLGMRLLYLPSGDTFRTKWQAPPGALIYGLALQGGVKRYRRIGNRKAGERTIIVPSNPTTIMTNATRAPLLDLSWLQYGGPERNYEALDIGPCLFLEVLLYPDGLEVTPLLDNKNNVATEDLVVSSAAWNPKDFLSFPTRTAVEKDQTTNDSAIMNMSQAKTFDTGSFKHKVILSVGGLQPQIDQIIRRVVDGRTYGKDNTDMSFLYSLGLVPVRGLLLYGPPGCGKTHLAREICRYLKSRPPKIVSAPELLDRWVGSTERNIRELFGDAEQELYQKCNGDPTKSELHVIVLDEIDAVFRKRSSSSSDSTSEVTRASAVNQILSKLDGVQSLDNILLIGMTNRKELLDPALLRPGRLETKIEIPLPNVNGRREILKIHFGPLRTSGRLSQPLCDAIDGVPPTKRKWWFENHNRNTLGDLVVQTKGFSGADIAGLARNAGSFALARTRRQSINGGIDSLVVTMHDVQKALDESKKKK